VWIHLDARGNPARIDDFGVYATAARDRRGSTRLKCQIRRLGRS